MTENFSDFMKQLISHICCNIHYRVRVPTIYTLMNGLK